MSAKIFASVLIGAIVGAASCYWVLKKEFENDLEKEVAEFKENYSKRKKKTQEEAPVAPLKKEKEASVEEKVYADIVKKQVTHYENYAKKYGGGRVKSSINVNMDKLTKKDMLDLAEDQFDEEDFDDEDDDIFPFEESDVPLSITSDDMANDRLHDKITLLYFKKDGLVMTEDDEEIEDPEKLLGHEWQEAIGEFEPNVAYIRNDKNMTIYEIVEENGHYIRE